MPNRIIKESYVSSPNLNRCPIESIETWARTLTIMDDRGCFEATPETAVGRLYPHQVVRGEISPSIFCARLMPLVQEQVIRLWVAGERLYAQHLGFEVHGARSCRTPDGKPTRHRPRTPDPPSDFDNPLVKQEVDGFLSKYGQRLPEIAKRGQRGPYPEPEPEPEQYTPLPPLPEADKEDDSMDEKRARSNRNITWFYGLYEHVLGMPFPKHSVDYMKEVKAAERLAMVMDNDGLDPREIKKRAVGALSGEYLGSVPTSLAMFVYNLGKYVDTNRKSRSGPPVNEEPGRERNRGMVGRGPRSDGEFHNLKDLAKKKLEELDVEQEVEDGR